MEKGRFSIIFEKLTQVMKEEASSQSPFEIESMRVELEEIAELRRLGLEISEPEPTSFTTT